MNQYEQKQEAKRERLLDAADRAESEADQVGDQSRQMMQAIPFGQPILVGHYSETRDRNYRDRAWNKMGKSIELRDKAKSLRARADAVGTGGISSDDPEAITKLEQNIAACEATQEKMKAANKIIKSKKLDDDAKVAKLVEELKFDEVSAGELLKPDFCGRIGFASYMLQNNNANIRRMKKRVEQLQANAERETREGQIGDIRVVENVEENRIQLFFPGKPSADVRTKLKRNGFKWSRYNECWQRQLTQNAVYATKYLLQEIA